MTWLCFYLISRTRSPYSYTQRVTHLVLKYGKIITFRWAKNCYKKNCQKYSFYTLFGYFWSSFGHFLWISHFFQSSKRNSDCEMWNKQYFTIFVIFIGSTAGTGSVIHWTLDLKTNRGEYLSRNVKEFPPKQRNKVNLIQISRNPGPENWGLTVSTARFFLLVWW